MRDLVHDGLEALFELTPVLGAGDDGGHVQGQDPVVLEPFGHLVTGDELGESFDDGGLPDPRLSDEDGIVLLPAAQDLHHPLDLVRTADGGVELALTGEIGQVAAEVIQCGRLRLLVSLAPSRRRRRAAATDPRGLTRGDVGSQDFQRLGPCFLQGDAQGVQHLGRNPLLFAKQSKEQVFRAHVGVVEFPGLGHGELEHLLGAGGIGKLAEGDRCLPFSDGLLYPLVDLIQVHAQVGEDCGRNPLSLPYESQEDVLRAHVVVLKPDGLFPRHGEDFPHSVGEVVVHVPGPRWLISSRSTRPFRVCPTA